MLNVSRSGLFVLVLMICGCGSDKATNTSANQIEVPNEILRAYLHDDSSYSIERNSFYSVAVVKENNRIEMIHLRSAVTHVFIDGLDKPMYYVCTDHDNRICEIHLRSINDLQF